MPAESARIGRDWLRRIGERANPGAVRLFYFPYASIGAAAYRDWGAALLAEAEAHAVQLPGREDRLFARPFCEMGELPDALVPDLLAALDRPFAFFGHSMGAIICWELSRRLKSEQQIEPMRIFVSGCRACSSSRVVHSLINRTRDDIVRRLGHGLKAE
ncbi:alpha/beta fold hydrolase [Nonomuraea sp. NPDC046802]|uniref:thioesterase II family protein n=1 Tax=Nonomuraea sp. NPDC046802 TaxID=3154919 RepID=UPI003408401D